MYNLRHYNFRSTNKHVGFEQWKTGVFKMAFGTPVNAVGHVLGPAMYRGRAGKFERHWAQATFIGSFAGMNTDMITQSFGGQKILRTSVTSKFTMLLMRTYMFVKHKFTCKFSSTYVTCETIVFDVCRHVFLQITGLHECGRTVSTLNRSAKMKR